MQKISGLGSNTVSGSTFSGVQSFKLNPNDMQEKMRAQMRETELREQEDEMIKNLQKQISQINSQVSNSIKDQEMKDAQIETLSTQIQNIYDNRTEREKQVREAELQKHKAEMEEARRKQEEASEKHKPKKTSDGDAIDKEDVEGMVKLAVSHDGLSALKKTKAALASEAARLPNEIENDAKVSAFNAALGAKLKGNYTQKMLDSALKEEFGSSSFKTRQLEGLNNGIDNLETAINTEIGRINKEVNDTVESKNEASNEDVKEEKPEDAETGNASENENTEL